MNSIMGPFIKDNGQKKGLGMVRAFKSGKMAASMRGTGKTIWLTDAVA